MEEDVTGVDGGEGGGVHGVVGDEFDAGVREGRGEGPGGHEEEGGRGGGLVVVAERGVGGGGGGGEGGLEVVD